MMEDLTRETEIKLLHYRIHLAKDELKNCLEELDKMAGLDIDRSWTLIKIDPKTLPTNGQKIRWVNDNSDTKEGEYLSSEDMFYAGGETGGDFDHHWHVEKWQPIKEDEV